MNHENPQGWGARAALRGSLRRVAILACIAGAACEAVGPELVSVRSVEVTLVHPLVSRLDIELDRPGPVVVHYDPGGIALVIQSPSVEIEHQVHLTRLPPSTTFEIEVMAHGGSWRGTATSDSLPPTLRALEIDGSTSVPGGLLMFEVNNPDGFSGAIVLDHEGRVVWYFETEGALTGSTVRANGDFVFVDLARGLVEVTPAGQEVGLVPSPPGRQIHHDVVEEADGGLLYLVTDPRGWNERTIVGDAIWRWTPERGATLVWSALDHLNPDSDWAVRSRDSDWLHANSLSVGPRGNFVMSLNFLNQVISIDSDAGSIEWRLGGPNPTIEVVPEGVFSGQHTATELAGDRVLLFDNGIERAMPFSRALELRLREGRAEVASDLRPNPANWSRAVSSAYRGSDGLTYVTYGLPSGLAGSTGPIESYVVGPSGEIHGHFRFTSGVRSVYRGSPLSHVGGESTRH